MKNLHEKVECLVMSLLLLFSSLVNDIPLIWGWLQIIILDSVNYNQFWSHLIWKLVFHCMVVPHEYSSLLHLRLFSNWCNIMICIFQSLITLWHVFAVLLMMHFAKIYLWSYSPLIVKMGKRWPGDISLSLIYCFEAFHHYNFYSNSIHVIRLCLLRASRNLTAGVNYNELSC